MDGVRSTGVLSAELKSLCLAYGHSAEEIAHLITKFVECHSQVIYKSGFGSSNNKANGGDGSSSGDGKGAYTSDNQSDDDADLGMDNYFSTSSNSHSRSNLSDDGSSISSASLVAQRRRDMSKILRLSIRGTSTSTSGKSGAGGRLVRKEAAKRDRVSQGSSENDPPVMSTVSAVILILVAKLRVIRCPHTESLPAHSMRKWDSEFVHVLLHSVFREYPSISWNRLMCQLMDSDLNETEPYDGSQGPVADLHMQALQLPFAVCDMLHEAGVAMNNQGSTGSGSGSISSSSGGEPALGLMERISPPSPQASLAFRAPSSLLLSDALGGWTLLHYLAATPLTAPDSSSSSTDGRGKMQGAHIGDTGSNRYRHAILQLMTYGVRIGEPDFEGRTPLHIAASCLNVECIHALITLGASVAVKTYAYSNSSDDGIRPLEALLTATGKCQWQRACTGPQLAQAVVALCGADVGALWKVGPSSSSPSSEGDREGEGIASIAGFESNALARIIALGEPTCIKALVGRSLLCPAREWNMLLARHLVMLAIKAKRAWLVEYLHESYSAVLDLVLPAAEINPANTGSTVLDWVTFWQECVTACVLGAGGDSEEEEKQREVLRVLLRRPSTLRLKLLRTSLLPAEIRAVLASELESRLTATYAPFLHCVILGNSRRRRYRTQHEDDGADNAAAGGGGGTDSEGAAGVLDLLLGSGVVGVAHVLGSWSVYTGKPVASDTTGHGGTASRLTASWLPSLYRYSSRPATPAGGGGGFAYQQRKSSDNSGPVVGLEAETAATGLCDVCPLSLAAFLGENALLRKLLSFLSLQPLGAYMEGDAAAAAHVSETDGDQDHFDTHGEGGAYTHRLSAPLLNSLAVSPIVACALSCNVVGLLAIRENMGPIAFAHASNQPDASGMVAVAAIMQMLGRAKREIGLSRSANGHEGALAGAKSHASVRRYFQDMHGLAAAAGKASSKTGGSGKNYSSSEHSLSLSASLSSDLEMSLQHLDASFSFSLSVGEGNSSNSNNTTNTARRPRGGSHAEMSPDCWDPEGSSMWALLSTGELEATAAILLDNLLVGPVMFRRPSQRSSNLQADATTQQQQHDASSVSASTLSGALSSSTNNSTGTFISTGRLWRLRENSLRNRIEAINRRLHSIVLVSRHGSPMEPYRELSALDVAQWVDTQLKRPAALGGCDNGIPGSPNLLHSLAGSVRTWQQLGVHTGATSFASDMRAMRALYKPGGGAARGVDKLLQAAVMLLEPEPQSNNAAANTTTAGGVNAAGRRGGNSKMQQQGGVSVAAAAWTKARAVLTGPASCSRKAMSRHISITSAKMMVYSNPFVSHLVSGAVHHSTKHTTHASESLNEKLVSYGVYQQLRVLVGGMPARFTEEHVSSDFADRSASRGDSDSDHGKGGPGVQTRVRVDRMLKCLNLLMAWIRAVLADGETVWGPPFTGFHTRSLHTTEIGGSAGHAEGGDDSHHASRHSGITTQDALEPTSLLPMNRLGVLEALSLTEGRTRLLQALARVPSYMYDKREELGEGEEDDEDEEDFYYEDLLSGRLPLPAGAETLALDGDSNNGASADTRSVAWSEDNEREGRGCDLKWVQASKEASATALLSLLLVAQGPSVGEGCGLLRLSRRAEAAAAVPVLVKSLTQLVKHAHKCGIYEGSPGSSSRANMTLAARYVAVSLTQTPRHRAGISFAATAAAAANSGADPASLLGCSGAGLIFETIAVRLLHTMIRVSSAPVPERGDVPSMGGVGARVTVPTDGSAGDVASLAPVAVTAQVPSHLLLALVAQGLYDAASQLLDACATHQLCLVHGDGSLAVGCPTVRDASNDGGSTVITPPSQLVEIDAFLVYGVPATATTTAWDRHDAFSFCEVGPLHLAVRDNTSAALAFARRYLEVFVDARLDVSTLLPFLPDDPRNRAGGTCNATLELVLARLGRITASQTTELNALYYLHGVPDVGPRLHGILSGTSGGSSSISGGNNKGKGDTTVDEVTAQLGAPPLQSASCLGSSRYAVLPITQRFGSSSSGGSDTMTVATVSRRELITAPSDYEQSMSQQLARALRSAVLLALADNAVVAASFWKLDSRAAAAASATSAQDAAGSTSKKRAPPRTPRTVPHTPAGTTTTPTTPTTTGAGVGGGVEPTPVGIQRTKPPKSAKRPVIPSKPPKTGGSVVSGGSSNLVPAYSRSRFALQLEGAGGALVEVPQAAGPMQGLCVVPRHLWDSHTRIATDSESSQQPGGPAFGNLHRRHYRDVSEEELAKARQEDGGGRGPLSKFYTRQRRAYERGPVGASSSILPPFSSDSILGGQLRRRKRRGRRARRTVHEVDGEVGISLMDGSVVPWRLFHLSLYNLLRATPLPALATGVNDTGLGLLHTIGSTGSPLLSLAAASSSLASASASAFSSLPAFHAAQRLLQTLGGKPRVLSISDSGLTPVFACLVNGGAVSGPQRFQLANLLLDVAGRSVANGSGMDVPLSVAQQYARHSVIAVSPKAPLLLLEQARARRVLAEREYIGAQTGGLSVATVTKPTDLLVLLMRETEQVWKALKAEDLSPLLAFSQGLSQSEKTAAAAAAADGATDGSKKQDGEDADEPVVLDSLQRARKVLALLKIPFSQLEEGVEADTSNEGDDSRGDNDDSRGPFTHTLRSSAFDSVNPGGVRARVSIGAAQQLKAELLGWLETRGVVREYYPHLGESASSTPYSGENAHPNRPGGATGDAAQQAKQATGHRSKWGRFGKYGVSLAFPALLEDCLALGHWLHLSFIDLGETPKSVSGVSNPDRYGSSGGTNNPPPFVVSSMTAGSGTFTDRLYSGPGLVSCPPGMESSSTRAGKPGGYDPKSGERYNSYLDRSFLGFGDLSRRVVDRCQDDQEDDEERGALYGRPLGMYSHASYSLMAQLVVETRQPRSTQGGSTSRGYAAYHPSSQHHDTQALLSFLHRHRKHPHRVRAALRQAYMVLDLARMLFLCRTLISVTQTVPLWARYNLTDKQAAQALHDAPGVAANHAATAATASMATPGRHKDPGDGASSTAATHITDGHMLAHRAALYRAAVVHPLDATYRRLQAFKEYEEGMQQLVNRAAQLQRKETLRKPTPVSASPPRATHPAAERSRAESLLDHARAIAQDTMTATDNHLRLKLCDLLTVEDLAMFLRLDDTLSPRYQTFKGLVWRGMRSMAELKGDPAVIAFLKRIDHLVAPADESKSTSTPAVHIPGSTRVKTQLTSAALLALTLAPPTTADNDSATYKTTSMARGSGLRALLAVLQSFSLRDVLSVDFSSNSVGDDSAIDGSSTGNAQTHIAAVLAAANALREFEMTSSEEEDLQAGAEGAGAGAGIAARGPAANRNSSSSTPGSPSRGGGSPSKGMLLANALAASSEDARHHSDRTHRITTADQDSTGNTGVHRSLQGLSAQERRLMHGVTPTEAELVEIEALVDAPPIILRSILQKSGHTGAASNDIAADSTPMKIRAGETTEGTGTLPLPALAQNYTMRSALLDDLHAAYRTANVLSWLLQALAGAHSRQLFFEPLVRDWNAMAIANNPLAVVPLAFSAVSLSSGPRAAAAAAATAASAASFDTSSQVTASAGPGRSKGRGMGDSLRLLLPLVTGQTEYMGSLSALLRKALASGDRLALGSARGLPLRLSCYHGLAYRLLSSSSTPGTSPSRTNNDTAGSGEDLALHKPGSLDTASLRESLATTRQLLLLGCNPCTPDNRGRAALSAAAVAGRADLVAELLEFSSDRQLKTLYAPGSAHRCLVWYTLMAASPPSCAGGAEDGNSSAAGHEETIRALLARGFPIDMPILGTGEEEEAGGVLSCLQLAILKRLPRACTALCSAVLAKAGSKQMQLHTEESGFPSVALALLWPQAKLHVVSEVLHAMTPSSTPFTSGSVPIDGRAPPDLSVPLPGDVGLTSVLPVGTVRGCEVHAHFMATQLGCAPATEGKEEAEEDEEEGVAAVCRRYLLRDSLLSLCTTLVTTYAPSPIGRSARHGECPLWRAARASIGMILQAVPGLTPSQQQQQQQQQQPRGGGYGATEQSPYARGHSHGIDRMTPGKRHLEDVERRRSSLDRALQSSVEQMQALQLAWADEGRYYEGYWSIFHFAVASGRADITSMVFRRFHLYASSPQGDITPPSMDSRDSNIKKSRFPSPQQLALLACFYDHPQAIMAAMLYSTSYLRPGTTPTTSGDGSSSSAVTAADGDRLSGVTKLYLGEFLNASATFPAAFSLAAANMQNKNSDAEDEDNGDDDFTIKGKNNSNSSRDGADAATPLQVAVHYGSMSALGYLCEVGVRVSFPLLIAACLAGRVGETQLVQLFKTYFSSNKDLRNVDSVEVGSDTSYLKANDNEGKKKGAAATGVVLRRGLAGRYVVPEMARQRALINAALTPTSMGGIRTSPLTAVKGTATVHPGETLLHLCARRNHAQLCALLLEYGGNARIRDDRGFTPLQASVSLGSAAVTRVLAVELPRATRAIEYFSVCVRAHLLRKARMALEAAAAAAATTAAATTTTAARAAPIVSMAEGVSLVSAPAVAAAGGNDDDHDAATPTSRDDDYEPSASNAIGTGGHYEPSVTTTEGDNEYEPSISSSGASDSGSSSGQKKKKKGKKGKK